VPPVKGVPQKVFICAAAGETGKHEGLFAGRLIRHPGATVTVLSVVPAASPDELGRQGSVS
jgi:hypothetical protein